MGNKKQTSSQNKINRLYSLGLYFILFLPIIVLPPTFSPSDWDRAILFRIAVSILLFALFFQYVKNKISINWRSISLSPVWLLSGFLAILVLSTIFSEDIRFSIFGSPSRAGGLLNYIFFIVFSLFSALLIKEKQWEKLWNFVFGIGVITSILAIIQYFKIFGYFLISYEQSPPSFLGSSTFLAIYLLFLSFFALIFAFKEKGWKKRTIYAGLFLLFSFIILITGSRATYVAMLLGLLYFFLFFPKKFKLFKIIAGLTVSLVVIIIISFNIFPQLIQKNSFLSRFESRFSIKLILVDLGETRFSAWKIAAEAIKDKPILGWGPENLQIGFEKHYDPALPNMEKLWWDRAHNFLFDIATTSGIPSLIIYLCFWIFLFWQLQKIKRTGNEDGLPAHGLQAIFIGYLTALFFNFDSFSTYLISFFSIGYAFHLISKQKEEKIILYRQKDIPLKKTAVIVFLILMIFFLFFWNIKPLYLNEKINYAEKLVSVKKCEKSLSIMENLWKNGGILKSYAGLRYADFIKSCASLHPEKEIEYVTSAVMALKESSVAQPKYTRTWLFLASFTNYLGGKETNQKIQSQLLEEAKNYINKGLELSPKRQELIAELAKNYLIAKDYEKVKKEAEKCQNLNKGFSPCYWYLGVSQIYLKEYDKAKENISIAKQNGYPVLSIPALTQLADAYTPVKNYQELTWIYAELAGIQPNNPQYHAALASVYKEVGEYQKAGAEAVRVFKLQPENKEVQEFLMGLLELSPNDPFLHSSLASVYKEIGEIEKSRQEYLTVEYLYSQLIAKYPKNPGYHFNLALAYKELQEYQKAREEALSAMKLGPGNAGAVEDFLQSLPNK